jgi:polar amino acid transport system substrate-binding protein
LKNQEKHTDKAAYYDTLTGLPNSNLFFDRLTQALTIATRNKKTVGVFFISVDRLKIINDTLGEDYGNHLLKVLAKRFRDSIRKSDTIARPGRDEFLILLPEIRYLEDAPLVAKKILASIEKPFVHKNHEMFLNLNIGISVFPNDGDDAKTLINKSYAAMDRARELKKNSYEFYSPAITEKAFEHMVLENNLRLALQRGEFILHYQPQIDLHTGQITGLEALVRWQRPGVGLVYPKDFLHIMEEEGLTIPLGEWALSTACSQNKAWQKSGLMPVRIAVNITASHFHEQDVVFTVKKILADTGLDPCLLEIELTESVFLQNIARTIKALKVLRGMGVNISIDDFGTGYSSLSYLKYFPMNKLKIVEPFISSVSFSNTEEVIARTIIAMAHTLNMKVIAEGVEKREQLKLIRSLKCDELQGNIISKPVPPQDVVKLLSRKKFMRPVT